MHHTHDHHSLPGPQGLLLGQAAQPAGPFHRRPAGAQLSGAGCGAFYSHITADLLAMVRLLGGEGRPPADIMDPGTRRALRPEEK